MPCKEQRPQIRQDEVCHHKTLNILYCAVICAARAASNATLSFIVKRKNIK
jgi:hypothetical protein